MEQELEPFGGVLLFSVERCHPFEILHGLGAGGVGGGHYDKGADPFGMGCGQPQGNHGSHGMAHQMGLFDFEMIQYGNGICNHVADGPVVPL